MMNVVQVNLHHAKAATAKFTKIILERNIKVALIQEPYLVKGRVAGLSGLKGTLHYDKYSNKSRACIYVSKDVSSFQLWNYTSQDMTAVKIKLQDRQMRKDYTFVSCYLPYEESNPVSTELASFVTYAEGEHLDFIIGMDANAHHSTWGSSDTNNRGEFLFQFISNHNLVTLNVGNKPTFVNRIRTEVIDITITTQGMIKHIHEWKVLDQIVSLSDHNYISFNVNFKPGPATSYRNPRNTDWDLYKRTLKCKLEDVNVVITDSEELDEAALSFQSAILNTMNQCCPETKIPNTKQPIWWNSKLDGLRKKTRQLWNKSKRGGSRESYYTSLTEYNREVRKAKRSSWRNFCERIDHNDSAARLQKIMARDPTFRIGNLVKPDGSYTTNGDETLEILMNTHFPDNRSAASVLDPGLTECHSSGRDWREASATASVKRIRAAISTFKPFKSPGPDGIYPVLLQEGLDVILPILCRLFRSSLVLGHIPKCWRRAKVVFLSKPGRSL